MGLSTIVGAIALVPAGLAHALRPHLPVYATAVLSHIAACGFAIAVAASAPAAPYSTWLLQKATHGKVGLLSSLVFWPYHLGLRGKLWIQRRVSTEPLYNKVLPELYIGGWPETAAVLPAAVQSVVDVTCELPRQHKLHYLCLPVWDTQAPSPAQIQQAVDWSLKEVAEGRSVYIHCAHGHGRSATVLAAVLMASGKASTPEQAVELMRSTRPRVRLNLVQKAALLAWIDAYYQPGRCAN